MSLAIVVAWHECERRGRWWRFTHWVDWIERSTPSVERSCAELADKRDPIPVGQACRVREYRSFYDKPRTSIEPLTGFPDLTED